MMRARRWASGLGPCAALALLFTVLPGPLDTHAIPKKDQAYGLSDELEIKLAEWQPPKGKLPRPPTERRSPETDIRGVWEINRGGLEFSRLTITPDGPQVFRVELHHTCCVAGWQLKRTDA